MLLSKLNVYKGDNLEVMHEALTFAGGIIIMMTTSCSLHIEATSQACLSRITNVLPASLPSASSLEMGVTGEVRHEDGKSEIHQRRSINVPSSKGFLVQLLQLADDPSTKSRRQLDAASYWK